MAISIKLKFVITLVSLTVLVALSNTLIISNKADQWFVDEARNKLDVGVGVVQAKMTEERNTQKSVIASLSLNDVVATNISMISELMAEESSARFDDAYVEMGKELAFRLQATSKRSGLNQLILYGQDGQLIAYYLDEASEVAWYVGQNIWLVSQHGEEAVEGVASARLAEHSFQQGLSGVSGHFARHDGDLAISLASSVMDAYDETVRIGGISAYFILDTPFVERLSELSKTDINIFVDGSAKAGTLSDLKQLSEELVSAVVQSESQSLNHGFTLGEQDYFSKTFSVAGEQGVVAYISVMDSKAQSDAKMADANSLLWSILLGAIVIGSLVSFFIAQRLVAPLTRLQHLVSDVEEKGDFSLRIDVGSHDEVGRTVQAFMRLLESLHRNVDDINKVMGRVAEGDLTVRVNASATGDLDKLKQNVNTSVAALETAIASIHQSTSQITDNVGKAHKASDTVLDGSNVQQRAIEQVAQSLDETSKSIAEVASNADQASGNAVEAVEIVNKGKEMMSHMVEVVSKISSSSEQINSITASINTIAEQTNLLALNAAIEAARAGEHGRGFAVVADEVRSLAGNAANSAHEIADLVSEAVRYSQEGVKISEQVSDDMSRISDSVSSGEEMLHLIAAAMEQQSSTLIELTDNAKTLREVGESSAGAASQIKETVEDLTEIAEQNRVSVDRFTVAGQ